MYKITFTVFSILIFAFNGYSADNKSKNNVENKKAETTIKAPDMSFNDDYFVGLKAYDDGLYDVAEYCLANYLKYENKSQKAGFATYLLYQVYMSQGNYKAAQYSFAQLANFKDSRFDRQKMLKDQMFIETKLNCNGAKNLLLTSPKNEYLEVYAKSSCIVDKDITNLLSRIDVSSETLYTVLERVHKDKELVFSTYDNLKAEKRTPKLMNFYGNRKCFHYDNRSKTKLACYMRKEDKEKISWFIGTLTVQDTLKLCEYSKYIIGKKLYNIKFLNKFERCPDKASMYESLLKFKDYNAVIKLGGSGSSQ